MHSEVSYRTKWALISWSSNHTAVCKEDGKLLWKLLSSAIKGCFLEGVFKDPEMNVAKKEELKPQMEPRPGHKDAKQTKEMAHTEQAMWDLHGSSSRIEC